MPEHRFAGTVVQTEPSLVVHGDISTKQKGAKDHNLHGTPPTSWQAGDRVTIVTNTRRQIIAVEHPKSNWQRPAPAAAPRPVDGRGGQQGGAGRGGRRGTANPGRPREAPRNAPGHGAMFLNPYALVPAPPRDVKAKGWGDSSGPGHDVLRADHWSGTIPVTIKTQSPLLLLDQGAADSPGDPVPVRERDGKPILEWSALKGMLRSYFEAVTNSRFSVVDNRHSQFIAMRQPAGEALKMRVGMVSTLHDGSGNVMVNTELAPQTYPAVPYEADPAGNLQPSTPMDPAVWVPRTLITANHLNHGDDVEAWVHLLVHKARPNDHGGGQPAFWYWRASDVAALGALHGAASTPVTGGRSVVPATTVTIKVQGKLLVGGQSFASKHDERLFVTKVVGGGPVRFWPAVIPFATDHSKRWRAIFDSYHQAREGNALPHPGWGRHNTKQGYESEKDLHQGQLLFVRVAGGPAVGWKLDGLFPVMIGRETFPSAPAELLDDGHRPAAKLSELSPADRLFGWARAEAGAGDRERSVDAYAGHVSCHSISCTRDDAIHHGEHPLWLSPLNSPKPEQFRFRLLNKHDEPIANGATKSPSSGYHTGMRLGRAAYWPHKGLPQQYWRWPDRLNQNNAEEVGYDPQHVGDGHQSRYREYLAPKNTKKKVTKAIRGWVRPNTEFHTTLRVDNVEPELLGTLLWLLHRGDDFTFMLGGGKPLGFGAVTVRADLGSAELAKGASWRDSFRAWADRPSYASEEELQALINEAHRTLPLRCRDVLLAMGKGVSTLPVHSPRSGPEPQAESYEWFVANEKPQAGHWANPAPDSPNPGLPYTP